MEARDWLDWGRLATGTVMLVGASWLDWRTRRVPNRYWFPFVAAAALLLAWDAATSPDLWALLLALAVAAALCGLLYLLWRARIMMGGADAKCLMLVAFLVPAPPPGAWPIPPVLGTLLLASLGAAILPLALFAVNAARGHWAFPAMLLGTPMPIGRARATKVWPMQAVAEDGMVRWRYWIRLPDGHAETLDRLEAAGRTEVWTTPKLPMALYLLIGWAAWGLWGATLVAAYRATLV